MKTFVERSYTIKDIYRLAGLVEGEGCLHWSIHKERPGATPLLAVSMTDKDVIDRAGGILGARTQGPYGPYKTGTKPLYKVQLQGKNAVGWVLTLYTLLGKRRREKIVEVVRSWRNRESRSSWIKRGWLLCPPIKRNRRAVR